MISSTAGTQTTFNNPGGTTTTTPTNAIPVPSPQLASQYSNNGAFSGFFIVADPLTPPAADQ